MQHRGEASRYGFEGRSGSVFDKQRACFATDATKTYEWRIDQLDRLSRMLKENESPLPSGCRDPQYRADVVLRSARLLKRHDYHVEISGGRGAAHTTCPISRSSLALSFRRTIGSPVSSGRPLRNRTGSSRSTWIRLSSSKARAEVVRLTRIEGALRLIFELSPWPPSCPVLKVADLLDN
jgi:hypothetical protein